MERGKEGRRYIGEGWREDKNKHIIISFNLPQVMIRFHGNRARVGPAMFISHLDLCAWFSVIRGGGNDTTFITATFSVRNFTSWPVFK